MLTTALSQINTHFHLHIREKRSHTYEYTQASQSICMILTLCSDMSENVVCFPRKTVRGRVRGNKQRKSFRVKFLVNKKLTQSIDRHEEKVERHEHWSINIVN